MSYMPLYQITNVKVYNIVKNLKKNQKKTKNVVHVILDNVTMSINF